MNWLSMRALLVALLGSTCFGQKTNHKANKRQIDPLLYDYIYGTDVVRPSSFRSRDEFELNEPGFAMSDDDLPPEESVDKRVLSSFRERIEKENEQNEYSKWLEPFLRDYEQDREMGNESNLNFERFLNELWEEYKASRSPYDYESARAYRSYAQRKRRLPEYLSLGWSGVGYRKRARPESLYRSADEAAPSQIYQIRRRQPLKRNYEMPDELPNNVEYFTNAKKKRNIANKNKRSSNYYANHHKRFAGKEEPAQKKYAKKESPSGTDPKIMKDLKSLFDVKESQQVEIDAHLNNKTGRAGREGEEGQVKKKTIEGDKKINRDEKVKSNLAAAKKEKHEEEHLNIKKKSLDWSNYFGYDRRKKSRHEPSNRMVDIDDKWLMERYENALSAAKRSADYPLKYFKNHDEETDHAVKQDKGHNEEEKKKRKNKDEEEEEEMTTATESYLDKSNEAKLLEMDSKLKNIEDLIIDEALKYTGAHEGTTDSQEIQEIKDKVISRLAAAYSLEKMRKALGEFKNSIAKQNNANHFEKELNEDRKRKVEAEMPADDDKQEAETVKKGDYRAVAGNEMSFDDGQMSIMTNFISGEMEALERRCRSLALFLSDHNDFFYPLCKWHQTCYLCSSEGGIDTSSATSCDMLFLSKTYEMCGSDPACEWSARPALAYLRDAAQSRGQPIDRTAFCTQIEGASR